MAMNSLLIPDCPSTPNPPASDSLVLGLQTSAAASQWHWVAIKQTPQGMAGWRRPVLQQSICLASSLVSCRERKPRSWQVARRLVYAVLEIEARASDLKWAL